MLNQNEISGFRLYNQQISDSKFNTPKKIVAWMGAMQAQDFSMAKWAIGVRNTGILDKDIEEAFNQGEILRTHLLRPTWHFVSADDIHWIVGLTAPHIRVSMNSRRKELGLTDAIIQKSNKIIELALSGGNHLNRKQIISALNAGGIIMKDTQAYYHLMLYAELEGVICSGKLKGKEHTYALLAERISKSKKSAMPADRENALAELGRRYFSSHGPATMPDFAWWSGLPLTDVRKSIQFLMPDLRSEKIDNREYWYFPVVTQSAFEKDTVYLLPAYDEFIISYKDRSPSLPPEIQEKTISSNGIFRPVIVYNTQVVGIWKKAIKKNTLCVEPNFFSHPNKKMLNAFEKSVLSYKAFLNKVTEVI